MHCSNTTTPFVATQIVAALLFFLIGPAMAESRGYVISWLATATYNDYKINCPLNKNGGLTELNIRQVVGLGYSLAEAKAIVEKSGVALSTDFENRIIANLKVNGKPASIYNYPDATEDPQIETVVGPFAYGFNLGGREERSKFEDPDTHEKVDNQLWRAVGCTDSFRATPPMLPYAEEIGWNLLIDTAPAYTMQISGEDLNRDGKVTVTIDRAIQHPERDATGRVMADATYVIDPTPAFHNVLQGEIKAGALTITPKDFYLKGESPFYIEIALRNAHMRFSVDANGKLIGYWGGYLNWRNWIYMYTSRPGSSADVIGMYHALKKMADAAPASKDGQNQEISATYRIEALPAYLANIKGEIVAMPFGGRAATETAIASSQ
jgi:hypothetical protein